LQILVHSNFQDSSSAGASAITNNPGGSVTFLGKSTAALSRIKNLGTLNFAGSSSAGNSLLSNAVGGEVTFSDTSTAASSAIANTGGFLQFEGSSNAGTSNIATDSVGYTSFLGSASASSATLVTNGGGLTQFRDSASAGTSNLVTNANGTTQVMDLASGGAAAVVTNPGGVFDISGLTISGTTAGSIAGGGNYNLGSKNLTTGLDNADTLVDGVIYGAGGSLTKVGTGTLTLTGKNEYTGATTVSSGVLQIGSGGATGSVAGDIVDNSALVFNRSDNVVYSGLISGAGTVTQAGCGSLALAGVNTYTGGTHINNGTVVINNDANLGDSSGLLSFAGGTLRTNAGTSSVRNVTLNSSGGTINTNGFNATFAGVISGPGGLVKTGPGMLTLNGSNAFSGGTLLTAGILAVGHSRALGSGDLVNRGGIIQATNGPLSIRVGGNFTQTAGTLALNIGGNRAGQFDQLLVAGSAKLGGTLQVNLVNSWVPRINDVYPVVAASQVSGTFSNILLPSSVRFLTDYLSNEVDLRVVPGQYPFCAVTGLTQNQKSVACYLDNYITPPRPLSDDFNSVLMALGSLDASGVKDALNQISPQVYEIYKKIAFQEASQR
jgi:autotransporter-associated beta strand protein